MSRIGKNPITLPAGVEVTISAEEIVVKGKKGTLTQALPSDVTVKQEDNVLSLDFDANHIPAKMSAGTTRAHISNMVKGVSEGFERKLTLIGVGYRAQAQGKKLNVSVGYSHPVEFEVPEGITIETPSQTEIVVKGINKQQIGQVAANIRKFRPPEPYKGKGIRYSDENVVRKEAKKK